MSTVRYRHWSEVDVKQDAIAESLRKVQLFAGLSDKSIATIASQANPHRFVAGEVVFEEDDSGRFGRLYVVLDGTAEVSIGGRTVATYGPGDYFGEMSVLDGKPRSATVTALSDLNTVGLSSWNMRAILNEHPEIGIELIAALVERLRVTDEKFREYQPLHD
jgi:CRP/FNR family cyclic AMP-dependent transcriptional regulator